MKPSEINSIKTTLKSLFDTSDVTYGGDKAVEGCEIVQVENYKVLVKIYKSDKTKIIFFKEY